MLVIRKGTVEEMKSLWTKPYTTEFFEQSILDNLAVFWVLCINDKIIGELYSFNYLSDLDFADGETTVYLCAFRVHKDYQGKGYGRQLIEHVLDVLKDTGYKFVTIGVEENELRNQKIYEKLGFDKIIKTVIYDPCDVDEWMKPIKIETFILLQKVL